jgi:purine-cytosine permease-like protein
MRFSKTYKNEAMKMFFMLLGLAFCCIAVLTGFLVGLIYKDSLLAQNDFLIGLSSSLFVLLLGIGLSYFGYRYKRS